MRGTRFVFAGSIAAFLVIAIITIVETAGYHIQWRPFQVEHVAGLSVLSTTKSSVFLNDEFIGSTPIRRGTMTPGVYSLRVSRDGFHDWEGTIRITGGQAKIVGPLTLLPTLPETVDYTLASDIPLPDSSSGIMFIAHPEGDNIWTIRDVTHQSQTSITLPEPPLAISASQDGDSFVITTKNSSRIVTGNGDDWSVAPLTEASWATISHDIVFGLRNGQFVALDALQKKETALMNVSSVVTGLDGVWTTIFDGQKTTVQSRDESNVAHEKFTTTLTGDWRLRRLLSGQLLLTQSGSGLTKVIKRQQVNGLTLTSLDSGEEFWQSKTIEPIIWRHGSEMMTQNKQSRPVFIDRWTTPVLGAWWYVQRDTLLWVDHEQVIARSVQPQTGDRQLASWKLPEGSTWLLLDQKDAVWVRTATTLSQLRWVKP